MSGRDDLFRVSFDNSGLARLLDEYDSRFQKHDTQIEELYSLLRGLPTKEDLDQLRNELKDTIAQELNSIRSEIQGKMEEIKKELDEKVQEMRDDVNKAIEDTKSLKEDKNNEITDGIEKLTNMVNGCEARVEENRHFIQTLASAHAGLNNSSVELDSSLNETLNNATEKVKDDIAKLFEALNKPGLNRDDNQSQSKDEIRASNSTHGRDGLGQDGTNADGTDGAGHDGEGGAGHDGQSGNGHDGQSGSGHDGEDGSGGDGAGVDGRNGEGFGRDGVDGQGSGKDGKDGIGGGGVTEREFNEKTLETREVSGEWQPKIDLSGLNLRPEPKIEFDEPPDLPKLEKFKDVESTVDYIYEVIPKLQAILNCYHDKIDSLPNTELDRDFLSELMDKIRGSMAGMAKEVEDLKNNMNKGLTRADVARMIREMSTVEGESDQTSVGCVKCIACGRDMRQVAGAMSEDEATRTMGPPPMSMAMSENGGVGQVYSRVMDRDSPESPRARGPRKYRPHPPH